MLRTWCKEIFVKAVFQEGGIFSAPYECTQIIRMGLERLLSSLEPRSFVFIIGILFFQILFCIGMTSFCTGFLKKSWISFLNKFLQGILKVLSEPCFLQELVTVFSTYINTLKFFHCVSYKPFHAHTFPWKQNHFFKLSERQIFCHTF